MKAPILELACTASAIDIGFHALRVDSQASKQVHFTANSRYIALEHNQVSN
jgi:hypothetical protein